MKDFSEWQRDFDKAVARVNSVWLRMMDDQLRARIAAAKHGPHMQRFIDQCDEPVKPESKIMDFVCDECEKGPCRHQWTCISGGKGNWLEVEEPAKKYESSDPAPVMPSEEESIECRCKAYERILSARDGEIEFRKREVDHVDALLVDCQKAHDCTIVERDELKERLSGVEGARDLAQRECKAKDGEIERKDLEARLTETTLQNQYNEIARMGREIDRIQSAAAINEELRAAIDERDEEIERLKAGETQHHKCTLAEFRAICDDHNIIAESVSELVAEIERLQAEISGVRATNSANQSAFDGMMKDRGDKINRLETELSEVRTVNAGLSDGCSSCVHAHRSNEFEVFKGTLARWVEGDKRKRDDAQRKLNEEFNAKCEADRKKGS